MGQQIVFYNGRFVGAVEDATSFIKMVKNERRSVKLPVEMSVRFDKLLDTVFISSEIGRVIRPLIIVKDGKSMLQKEHLELVKDGALAWKDLFRKGILEYLDAAEEDDCYICLGEDKLTEEHTHLEIDELDIFGVSVSLITIRQSRYLQPVWLRVAQEHTGRDLDFMQEISR